MSNPSRLRPSAEQPTGRRFLVGAGQTVGTLAGIGIGGAIGLYLGAEAGIAFSPQIHELTWIPSFPPINFQEGADGIIGTGFGMLFGGPIGYNVASYLLKPRPTSPEK